MCVWFGHTIKNVEKILRFDSSFTFIAFARVITPVDRGRKTNNSLLIYHMTQIFGAQCDEFMRYVLD